MNKDNAFNLSILVFFNEENVYIMRYNMPKKQDYLFCWQSKHSKKKEKKKGLCSYLEEKFL